MTSRNVVVLCTHQGERFIEAQLRSILEQTLPVDRIFVFDFASTDATLPIVRATAAGSGVPIEVTAHADAPGAAASFFRAFEQLIERLEVRDCVFLADQDDVWLPEKVERMSRRYSEALAASACEDILVFHDVKVTDDALRTLRDTYYTGDPFRVPRDLSRDRVLLSNPVIGHTMAVSAGLLGKVTRTARSGRYLMHDWALLLFASRHGEIGFEPASLSLYRQHGANLLGAYRARPWREKLSRTWGFSRRVVWQALAFASDVRRVPTSTRRPAYWLDAVLWFADRFAPPLGFLALGLCALGRGPTWRRRVLGLLVLARAGSLRDDGPSLPDRAAAR